MNPTVSKLYKEIAKKHGITPTQVKEIVESQFKFVKDTMASGIKNVPESFKSIQLTNLGKFAVRTHKLEEYKRKAERRSTETRKED